MVLLMLYKLFEVNNMKSEDYIRKEREIIIMECMKLKITPLEWIEKFALSYYQQNAGKVLHHYQSSASSLQF